MICKDEKCETELKSHSHLTLTPSNYEVSSTRPLRNTTLYMGAMTKIGKPSLAIKSLKILICGYETISTPKGTTISETKKAEDNQF